MRSGKLSSSQSSVFLVRRIETGIDYYLKIIQQKDMKSYWLEKKALLEFKKNDLCRFGFPELISYQESDDHAEMLLEALGFNLRQVILELPTSNFSKASCYKIMLQLIDLIEKLHSINLVHNDLKLENIVVGVRDPAQLHLIDFGLTQSLVDENGKHIQKCYMKNFSGNFMFSSLNSCRGFNKSRRDDIESIFYILIFMLNN